MALNVPKIKYVRVRERGNFATCGRKICKLFLPLSVLPKNGVFAEMNKVFLYKKAKKPKKCKKRC